MLGKKVLLAVAAFILLAILVRGDMPELNEYNATVEGLSNDDINNHLTFIEKGSQGNFSVLNDTLNDIRDWPDADYVYLALFSTTVALSNPNYANLTIEENTTDEYYLIKIFVDSQSSTDATFSFNFSEDINYTQGINSSDVGNFKVLLNGSLQGATLFRAIVYSLDINISNVTIHDNNLTVSQGTTSKFDVTIQFDFAAYNVTYEDGVYFNITVNNSVISYFNDRTDIDYVHYVNQHSVGNTTSITFLLKGTNATGKPMLYWFLKFDMIAVESLGIYNDSFSYNFTFDLQGLPKTVENETYNIAVAAVPAPPSLSEQIMDFISTPLGLFLFFATIILILLTLILSIKYSSKGGGIFFGFSAGILIASLLLTWLGWLSQSWTLITVLTIVLSVFGLIAIYADYKKASY